MSSSRLSEKVLKDILGKPMLARQIERVRRAETIDELIVATSDQTEDDAIEALCRDQGVMCFRGSLDDVLDRYYQCALPHNPDHVVRLTGDCPLADPAIIDQVVRFHQGGDYDYTSNALTPTWPDGMDVEAVRMACLRDAWSEAELPSEREHVTVFINKRPDRFRLGSVIRNDDQSAVRLTVDEPEDLELVRRIYEHLYPGNPAFGMDDIMNLLSQSPDLMTLNECFARNEGLRLSEQKDAQNHGADE